MQKILKAAVDRGDVDKEVCSALRRRLPAPLLHTKAPAWLRATAVSDGTRTPPQDLEAAGLASPLMNLSEASAEDLALATYDQLIERCLADPSGIESAAEANYDRIDMRFLERLSELAQKASGDRQAKLNRLSGAIQACMSDRIQKASVALQTVLKAGTPEGMQKQLMLLNAKGGLDESVILLLEANIDQANKAGAAPAAEVMSKLKEKAIEFKDASLPEEIRLIRQLLRTDDEDARKTLMVEAFQPRERMLLADGTESKPQNVNGRRFVSALRDMIEKYGNVEDKFLTKINLIARESEKVASELFGLGEQEVSKLQVPLPPTPCTKMASCEMAPRSIVVSHAPR